jgi:hypothetical protein
LEPPTEPPAADADAREAGPAGADDPAAGGTTGEFFARLEPDWPLTARQQRRLAPAVTDALAGGWAPAVLATFVGANTAGVRNPAAVLAARLSPAELPAPPGLARARPTWCGACDEGTRLAGYDGDAPRPCPVCHPRAADPAAGCAGPPPTAVPPADELAIVRPANRRRNRYPSPVGGATQTPR